MNGWASTSHRTTSFAPPNSQGGAAGNRVSPLAFKWLAADATGCERAIFGNPRWTDAHRRTHRTTTSRRDQATRNGTPACAVATQTGNLCSAGQLPIRGAFIGWEGYTCAIRKAPRRCERPGRRASHGDCDNDRAGRGTDPVVRAGAAPRLLSAGENERSASRR